MAAKTPFNQWERQPREVFLKLRQGAYQVSEKFALSLGDKTNKAYKKYMENILTSKHLFSIASHDEEMIDYAETFIKSNNITTDIVEFEMLHGVKPEVLSEIHEKGYQTREYLPYGKEWYLYLCHRLAENPENIYQALADAVGI